jgi:ubiquinone/menaquinone biosynthesis C-methylase UbiE
VDLNLCQMPGENLRFEKDSFDGILCVSAYHHMDQERAATEFARVLRPGGRLVVIDPCATNPSAWLYRRIGDLFSREATSRETPLICEFCESISAKWSGGVCKSRRWA